MPTPMTIEMENEMTKDEIQAAIKFINDKFDQDYIETEEYYHIFKYHGDTIRSALQSAQVKAETVDIPEGFRMSPEQNIVWEWADAHGLTLVVDECNDLLWRLEKTK